MTLPALPHNAAAEEDLSELVPEDDLATAMERIQAAAREAAARGEVYAFAAGTFAVYPTGDGGFMFVTQCVDGPMAGLKHTRIPPGMMRIVSAAISSGSTGDRVRALFGRKPKPRKAIDGKPV